MTRRALFVVGALFGITYLAADVAAQSVEITSGNVGCNGQQNAFIATWKAALNNVERY